MQLINKIFIVSLIIIIFLSACKKNNTGVEDSVLPTVTIAEPMANDTLSLTADPEVHVEFTTTDETGLKSIQVWLVINGTDTLLNEDLDAQGVKTYAYHEHAVPSGIIAAVNMKAVIRVEDYGNNVNEQIVNFVVTP